jgi:hypothetical protein
VLRDEISPETARVLTDMNGAAYVIDFLPYGLFVACAAGAALMTRTLGRILGWGGVAVGTVTAVALVVSGVHAMTTTPLPFLLCGLWILAVSVRLAIQRTSRTAAEPAPAPMPAGV